MPNSLVGANKVTRVGDGSTPYASHADGITVQVGDVVVVGMLSVGASGVALSSFGLHGDSTATLSSWTTLSSSAIGSVPDVFVGRATVTGAGLVRPIVTLTNAYINGQVFCFAVRGSGGVGEVSDLARGDSTSPATDSVTPNAEGDWVVGIYAGMQGAGTWVGTADWTTIESAAWPYSDSGWVNFGIEYLEVEDDTPIAGAPTLDSGGSELWAAISFVIEVAVEVAPGTTVSRGLLF